MTVDAYPLSWPVAFPRTAKRQRSQFKVSFATARDGLLRELALLKARDVVINSNVPTRLDGLPYSNQADPDDPAVAVYFTLHGEQKCIPCDRWDRAKDNLRAVELTVAALRGLDRWGTHQIVAAAFAGFAALPATASGDGWWTVLGVQPSASREEIDSAYRFLVRMAHPDRGGDVEAFHRLQAAYEQATKGR